MERWTYTPPVFAREMAVGVGGDTGTDGVREVGVVVGVDGEGVIEGMGMIVLVGKLSTLLRTGRAETEKERTAKRATMKNENMATSRHTHPLNHPIFYIMDMVTKALQWRCIHHNT